VVGRRNGGRLGDDNTKRSVTRRTVQQRRYRCEWPVARERAAKGERSTVVGPLVMRACCAVLCVTAFWTPTHTERATGRPDAVSPRADIEALRGTLRSADFVLLLKIGT
jgi:hypothetical protein